MAVVSRPVGWARDLLADGRCGRVSDDPQAKAGAIHEMVATSRCWRQRCGELQDSVRKFTVDAWIDANDSLALRLAK